MRIPSTVRTVAAVIGIDAAVRLMQVTYRPPNGQGGSLYIPAREMPGHKLATVLQPSEMRAITRAFGGELLSYPSARGMKRKIKAERKARGIQQDIANGLPTADIAAKHKVSCRYVTRIKSTGSTSSRVTRKSESDYHF